MTICEKILEIIKANEQNCGCCGEMDHEHVAKEIVSYLDSIKGEASR